MKWTEYPTRADWREGRNGTEREGQVLAPAPGGGRWVVAPGEVISRVRTLRALNYSIREEDP